MGMMVTAYGMSNKVTTTATMAGSADYQSNNNASSSSTRIRPRSSENADSETNSNQSTTSRAGKRGTERALYNQFSLLCNQALFNLANPQKQEATVAPSSIAKSTNYSPRTNTGIFQFSNYETQPKKSSQNWPIDFLTYPDCSIISASRATNSSPTFTRLNRDTNLSLITTQHMLPTYSNQFGVSSTTSQMGNPSEFFNVDQTLVKLTHD